MGRVMIKDCGTLIWHVLSVSFSTPSFFLRRLIKTPGVKCDKSIILTSSRICVAVMI